MSDDKPYTIKVEVPTHLDEEDSRSLIEVTLDGIASIFENISAQLRARNNSSTQGILTNALSIEDCDLDQETPCDNEEVVVYKDRLLNEDHDEG
jgi:hypothetical protein